VKQGIKKQEDSIKERIKMRKMRSETGNLNDNLGSVKNLDREPSINRMTNQVKINGYFGK
jgi:hypothetical protein